MTTRNASWAVVITLLSLPLTLAAEETSKEEGFDSLFDGVSLNGWQGTDAYRVEEGSIICVPGGRGNLLTKREYADFTLRFDFKLTPGANNGLGIRCPLKVDGNLHLDGIEIQILDDSAEKYQTLKPYQYHGSIYGLVPAKRGSLKPVGEWNSQEVTARGRNIQVIVNGQIVVDANLDEALKSGPMDGASHPGFARASGHIGLLGHGDRVEIRNLRIREFKP